jgi:hypothetical protein
MMTPLSTPFSFLSVAPMRWPLALALCALIGMQLAANLAHFAYRKNEAAEGKVNTLCTENPEKSGSGDPLEAKTRHFACHQPQKAGKAGQNPLRAHPWAQFQRFALIITDSLPLDQTSALIDRELGKNAVVFRVDSPGIRYSHTVYDAYWRGQMTTNAKGEEMAGDNLFGALDRSGIRIVYEGSFWPIVAAVPPALRDSVFAEIHDIHEERSDGIFPSLFGPRAGIGLVNVSRASSEAPGAPASSHDGQQQQQQQRLPIKDAAERLMRHANSQNASLFVYTGVLDKNQHEYYPTPRQAAPLQKMISDMTENYRVFRKLAEENPDVLFIFTADHGYDEAGPRGVALHGYSRNGNEPGLIFYSPKFRPEELPPSFADSGASGSAPPPFPASQPQPVTAGDIVDEIARAPLPPEAAVPQNGFHHRLRWIRMVDVAATITQYLRGVDVPRNVVGIPQNWFGTDAKGALAELRALLQSAVQLRRVARERGAVSFDDNRVAKLQEDGVEVLASAEKSGYELSSVPTAEVLALSRSLRVELGRLQADFLRHVRPPIVNAIGRMAIALAILVFLFGRVMHDFTWNEILLALPRSLPRAVLGRATVRERASVGVILGIVLCVAPWFTLSVLYLDFRFDKLWLTGTFEFWYGVVVLAALGWIMLNREHGSLPTSSRTLNPTTWPSKIWALPNWFKGWVAYEAVVWGLLHPLLSSDETTQYLAAMDTVFARDGPFVVRALSSAIVINSLVAALWPLLPAGSPQRRVTLSSVALHAAYCWTEGLMGLYFVANIHIFHALFLVSLVYQVIALDTNHFVVPLALLTFATWRFEPHALLLFSACLGLAIRLVMSLRVEFRDLMVSAPTSTASGDIRVTSENAAVRPSSSRLLAFTLTVFLLFTCTFAAQKFLMASNTDIFNVPVRAASVGVSGTTKRPLLNGFNMAWNKVGILSTAGALVWRLQEGFVFVATDKGRYLYADAWLVWVTALALWGTGSYELLLNNYTYLHNLQHTFGLTVTICFAGIFAASQYILDDLRKMIVRRRPSGGATGGTEKMSEQ